MRWAGPDWWAYSLGEVILSCIQAEFPISLQKLCCSTGKKTLFWWWKSFDFQCGFLKVAAVPFCFIQWCEYDVFLLFFFQLHGLLLLWLMNQEKVQQITFINEILTERSRTIRKIKEFWASISRTFITFFSYGNDGTRRIYLEIEFKNNFKAWTCALKKSISPCWAGSFVCVHMKNLT